MKVIAKLAGGSHLYGLSTPESDYDERYVYLSTNVKDIIGLEKNEFIDNRDGNLDSFGYELRNFLVSLRKTNTQAMEILCAPEASFIELHPIFKEIKTHEDRLINPHKFYQSLKGYIQGEKRLANGERTGKLGGKRKDALDKYGFSPKNFVQLLRLARCGQVYFDRGFYPVNIVQYDPVLGEHLMKLKTNPGAFNKEELNKEVELAEAMLDRSYETAQPRLHNFFYNEDVANQLILEAYFTMLCKLLAERHGL